jgi:hypothetical protein
VDLLGGELCGALPYPLEVEYKKWLGRQLDDAAKVAALARTAGHT